MLFSKRARNFQAEVLERASEAYVFRDQRPHFNARPYTLPTTSADQRIKFRASIINLISML
jgi:hypothetical protein